MEGGAIGVSRGRISSALWWDGMAVYGLRCAARQRGSEDWVTDDQVQRAAAGKRRMAAIALALWLL